MTFWPFNDPCFSSRYEIYVSVIQISAFIPFIQKCQPENIRFCKNRVVYHRKWPNWSLAASKKIFATTKSSKSPMIKNDAVLEPKNDCFDISNVRIGNDLSTSKLTHRNEITNFTTVSIFVDIINWGHFCGTFCNKRFIIWAEWLSALNLGQVVHLKWLSRKRQY